MNEFVPHKIDAEESFESTLLGDVKTGFPSPAVYLVQVNGTTRKVVL